MGGRFDDRLTDPLPGLKDIVRLMAGGGFRPTKATPDELAAVPRVAPPVWDPAFGGLAVTWIGHATFVVEIGGKVILTDPVWTERLPGFIPRLTRPGAPLEELPPIDAIVVSHNHYDHLDAWTFKQLRKHGKLTDETLGLAPLGTGKLLRRLGTARVQELDWWQSADLGDGVKASLVPSHHWTRRTPWDTNEALWGGWVLEGAGRSAHFSGDTAYGKWFAEIGQRFPKLDVTMLPIGAYDPRWFMQKVHMDPDEAVKACRDMGAKHMATMHWATFPLTREPLLQPLERTRTAWTQAKLAPDGLWAMALGERRVAP